MELQSEPSNRQQFCNCKLWRNLTGFYHKHFPTDKQSFNQRIPFLGFVCSLASVFCLVPWIIGAVPVWFIFLVLSFGSACQLYCGLKNADRKQFTPWIILKFLELTTVLIVNIVNFVSLGGYWVHNAYYVVLIILFVVSTIFNVWIFYVVVDKSCRMNNFRMRQTTTVMCSSNNASEAMPNKCQLGTGSVIIECTSEEVVS